MLPSQNLSVSEKRFSQCMICEYVGCLSDVAASDTETSSAVQASTTATSKEAIDAEIALEQQGCVKLRINYFY